jgi:oligopeptide/dipeptide ABC transporter ATP-binding protein
MLEARGMSTPLLEVRDLRKYFPIARVFGRPRYWVHAVDGITMHVDEGETVSLVGESGCGKTTFGKLILGLEKPTSGEVIFAGGVEAVFQDPWSSLNPRRRIVQIVGEPLVAAGRPGGGETPSRTEVEGRVRDLLQFVGLDPSVNRNFPHEFSGGQRQRIAIARALAVRPRLIVLDEPVSALDVSIRAQIINLLRDIQDELGTSYLMIAHDLATVRFLSRRVAVMYLGVIVEEGPSARVFGTPLHPYTEALLSASLPLTPGVARKRIRLEGEVPSAINPPSGCRFRTRCSKAFERCALEVPAPRHAAPGHTVACHLYE